MSTFGRDLIASMEEAAAHARGEQTAARAHIVVPDVRAIREGLGLSQHAFASTYRIPLATLKGWEQCRRQPDATASAYLSVIAHLPDAARARCRRSERRGIWVFLHRSPNFQHLWNPRKVQSSVKTARALPKIKRAPSLFLGSSL
jgi:putative transcriptional regulator